MKQTSGGPTTLTTVGRAEQAKVFRVECAGVAGWVVYLVDDPQRYGFLSQDLATTYAHKLARENRPSVVVVVEADGTVVRGWEFPVEAPTVA